MLINLTTDIQIDIYKDKKIEYDLNMNEKITAMNKTELKEDNTKNLKDEEQKKEDIPRKSIPVLTGIPSNISSSDFLSSLSKSKD